VFTEVDRIHYNGFSLGTELNKDGSVQFGCRPEVLSDAIKDRLRNLVALPCEIWVYEDENKIFAGPITSLTYQQGTLSVYVHGLLYYLNYMFIDSNLDFQNTDQFAIARTLINQWQSLSWGHFGIDVSATNLSGVLRDRTQYLAENNPNVRTKIDQLSQVINGFDFAINPSTRELELFYPQKGEDKSNEVFLDHRNIEEDSTSISVQSSDVASVGHGTGTARVEDGDTTEGVVVTSRQFNQDTLQSFGRAGIANSWDGVSQQNTIDNHTKKLIANKGDLLLKSQSGLVPVAGATRRDFDTGDIVTYSYDYGVGLYTYTPRVRAIRIGVSEMDNETLSVEFD